MATTHAQNSSSSNSNMAGAAAPGGCGQSPNHKHHQQQQQPVQQCWQGALAIADLSSFLPDAGPVSASARAGVIAIGATPWVVNFNVPVTGGDLAVAKEVARAVSTRGGGLPAVEVRGQQKMRIRGLGCGVWLVGFMWKGRLHGMEGGGSGRIWGGVFGLGGKGKAGIAG